MTRFLAALLSLASLALVGCVSKSAHEAIQVQLDECRADKQAAQGASDACEKRYDREIARFDTLDSTLEEVVPDALATFRSEREEILEQVPVQVRDEVESYLDEFATAVARSFQRLSDDNEKILGELGTAKIELAKLSADTEALIAAGVDTTIQEVREGQATRETLDARSSEIVALILQFDRTRVNCKNCDERLRLNKKEIQAITAFHATLIESLQGFAAPIGSQGEEPMDKPMPDDDMDAGDDEEGDDEEGAR